MSSKEQPEAYIPLPDGRIIPVRISTEPDWVDRVLPLPAGCLELLFLRPADGSALSDREQIEVLERLVQRLGSIVLHITRANQEPGRRRVVIDEAVADAAGRRHSASLSSELLVTPAEREALDKLVEAWNAFVKLPVEHADDATEFRQSFHALQRQILARPARRLFANEPVTNSISRRHSVSSAASRTCRR